MIHYALFRAHPATEPPFIISLRIDEQMIDLADCQDIPDGVQRILQYCQDNAVQFSSQFVLLYPIYMDAMNTDAESTMHQIAWLIKDEADAKGWQFNRIGGLTGTTEKDFVR
jgi:hypothetical protein